MQLIKNNKNFTDISLSFQPNPLNGDITVLKNERAINNSLKNCVMTGVGEAPFNEDFGSVINSLLFEPTDLLASDMIESEVRRAIEFNEPRVELQDVKARVNQDAGDISVSVKYNITGYDETINAEFILTPSTT